MSASPPHTIMVCGAGQMGRGIGQVLAVAGHQVRLHEPDRARAEGGLEAIEAALVRAVGQARLTQADGSAALRRLRVVDSVADGASDVDLVIEAAVEDEQVKRDLFERLDAAMPASTVLASNTSSITITRLADAVSVERRPRVIGMHFFNPVPAMPLVEIIRSSDTSDATELLIRDVVEGLGKTPIVSADRPGFIVNRMLFPLLAEAMRALEEGVGTAADIDAGARLGLGHPMGPLALADHIGLDVCLQILEVLSDGVDAARFEPPAILRQLVDAGNLGRKSGRGFHDHEPA